MPLLIIFIYILIYAFSSISIPFGTTLAVFHKFRYVVFSLGSKCFISILISLMAYGLFECVLLNFQTFGGFLFMFLVLISHLMLL